MARKKESKNFNWSEKIVKYNIFKNTSHFKALKTTQKAKFLGLTNRQNFFSLMKQIEKISKKDEDEKCPICYEFINIIKENGKEIFTPSSCKHQICVECFGRMCRAFPYVQLKYDYDLFIFESLKI